MASKPSLLLYPHFLLLLISSISAPNPQFNQKSTRFFEFEQKTNRWVEIRSPYDLTSCSNDTCIKIGSIETNPIKNTKLDSKSDSRAVLRIRKRVSVTAMSEASVWITGQSGSIFERFWNGVMWVVAPHDLPEAAGAAVEVFVVNQSVLAVSEDGMIYQLQLDENSQPVWIEFVLKSEPSIDATETETNPTMRIKTGAVSNDGGRLFLTTIEGSLLEIYEFQPLRWENHGRPPGGDVSAVADTGVLKASAVFSIRILRDEVLYSPGGNSRRYLIRRRDRRGSDDSWIPESEVTLLDDAPLLRYLRYNSSVMSPFERGRIDGDDGPQHEDVGNGTPTKDDALTDDGGTPTKDLRHRRHNNIEARRYNLCPRRKEY